LEQFYRNNITSLQLGDSLWVQLFHASYYKRAYTEGSYSEKPIKELIDDHLVDELRKDDWNFFIGILIFLRL